MNDLTNEFWNEHFRGKERVKLSKIKQKVFDWLNKDNFGGFAVDRLNCWIEKTWSGADLPNYIYNYLMRWAKRRGYNALY